MTQSSTVFEGSLPNGDPHGDPQPLNPQWQYGQQLTRNKQITRTGDSPRRYWEYDKKYGTFKPGPQRRSILSSEQSHETNHQHSASQSTFPGAKQKHEPETDLQLQVPPRPARRLLRSKQIVRAEESPRRLEEHGNHLGRQDPWTRLGSHQTRSEASFKDDLVIELLPNRKITELKFYPRHREFRFPITTLLLKLRSEERPIQQRVQNQRHRFYVQEDDLWPEQPDQKCQICQITSFQSSDISRFENKSDLHEYDRARKYQRRSTPSRGKNLKLDTDPYSLIIFDRDRSRDSRDSTKTDDAWLELTQKGSHPRLPTKSRKSSRKGQSSLKYGQADERRDKPLDSELQKGGERSQSISVTTQKTESHRSTQLRQVATQRKHVRDREDAQKSGQKVSESSKNAHKQEKQKEAYDAGGNDQQTAKASLSTQERKIIAAVRRMSRAVRRPKAKDPIHQLSTTEASPKTHEEELKRRMMWDSRPDEGRLKQWEITLQGTPLKPIPENLPVTRFPKPRLTPEQVNYRAYRRLSKSNQAWENAHERWKNFHEGDAFSEIQEVNPNQGSQNAPSTSASGQSPHKASPTLSPPQGYQSSPNPSPSPRPGPRSSSIQRSPSPDASGSRLGCFPACFKPAVVHKGTPRKPPPRPT